MLDRDLEEAEEQYQMAHRAHLQNLDALIDLQDSRLLALENQFEEDLSTLEDEYTAEKDYIVKQVGGRSSRPSSGSRRPCRSQWAAFAALRSTNWRRRS